MFIIRIGRTQHEANGDGNQCQDIDIDNKGETSRDRLIRSRLCFDLEGNALKPCCGVHRRFAEGARPFFFLPRLLSEHNGP